jgi:PTH1 family peptidyl-tRNA hydrolase
MEAADYVLEPFSVSEMAQLGEVVQRASESIDCLLREGIERAMARYNRAS